MSTRYCDKTQWIIDSSDSPSDSSTIDEYTDTLTNVRTKDLVIVDCSDDPLGLPSFPDCEGLCANDETYYRLFNENDILNLQFRYKNDIDTGSTVSYGWNIGSPANYFIEAWLVSCCDTSNETSIEDVVYVRKGNTQDYVGKFYETIFGNSTIYHDVQGIKIDTSLVPYLCFYLKVRVHHDLTGTNYTEYNTEPYKKIDCRNRERYSAISSNYNWQDDLGFFYGFADVRNGAKFVYENDYIVPGHFEQVQIAFEKDYLEDILEVSSTQNYRYRLRVKRLNEYAAKVLGNVVGGKDLVVAGKEVILDSAIDKNFDDGKSWWSEVFFKEYFDEQDFTCDT